MISSTDQTGKKVELKHYPKRIVSTVPSQTELLCYLGLEEALVGITAYCVHPENLLKEKTVIGGTKDLRINLIKDLKPDLIIANKEENVKEQIEALAVDIPVWISDAETFEEGIELIDQIGSVCDKTKEAQKLVADILKCKEDIIPLTSLPTLYFIWKEPYMVAGKSTYINSMMELCGLQNIAPEKEQRYPQLAYDGLKNLNPKLVLLTSEPYSFSTEEAHEMARIFPNAIIKIVDGEMFSWYGNRMLNAMHYFQKLCKELFYTKMT